MTADEIARIRAEALEEAARVAEDYDTGGFAEHRNMVLAQKISAEIAERIRALIPKEPS